MARLLMVLSSISPLFVLWAIRGSPIVPDCVFIALCGVMAFTPNISLWLRLRTSMHLRETRELVVGKADDHRNHVLLYLFAILLPFYRQDLASWRDLGAAVAALCFIVFLFMHLNLHYMNFLFALWGYRTFTILPPDDGNVYSGKGGLVLMTKRNALAAGQRLIAYRLSDTVYVEKWP